MVFHGRRHFFFSLFSLLLPGDYFIFVVFLFLCTLLGIFFWDHSTPEQAQIYQNGQLLMQLSLNQKKEVRVMGTLGESIIEIDWGKARVKKDPGAKQYCVKQNWLKKSGDVAICAPSQLSLKIVGRAKIYDSLNY